MPSHLEAPPLRALVMALCSLFAATHLAAFSNPLNNPALMTGQTLKSGGNGCASCHSSQSFTTNATLAGPLVLFPGHSATYTLTVGRTTATALKVGFDIAADDAASLGTIAGQPEQVLNGEIVHDASTVPLPTLTSTTSSATVSFTYQMPSSATAASVHQLYAVGDAGYSGGFWRHAANLAVAVAAPPYGLTVDAASGSSLSFSWSGNTTDYRAIIKSGSLPSGPTDGTLVFEGAGARATATGLTPSTRYFLAVYGKDAGTATYTTSAATLETVTPAAQLVDLNGTSGGERQSNTSQGQVLYGNDPVALFNGTSVITVQKRIDASNEDVDPIVFTLGSGSTAGHVIGAWRRGTDHGWVSVDGGTPVLVTATNPIAANQPMNPENVAVADGCVFMDLQAFSGGQAVKLVFKVDPLNGNAVDLTGSAPVPGLNGRIRTSGCKAVWTYDDNSGSPKLDYYDGSAVQVIDSGAFGGWISHGKIVYVKKDASNISQVFLYDTTAASPASVQLTSNTDPSTLFGDPETDGRHIAWLKTTGTTTEIDLNGGIALATGVTNVGRDLSYQLNRGQILWRDSSNRLRYETSASSSVPDISSTATNPWLADGYIAYGDKAAPGAFRFTGSAPDDALQPAAPLVVHATHGSGSVTLSWDSVLGATSYNIYYALQSGVSPSNYAGLPGGTRITGATSPTTITLAPGGTYAFVVTSVEGTTEGPASRQVAATMIGTLGWVAVGNQASTTFYAAASDPANTAVAYAAGGNNVYKTSDGGQTWTALAGGIAGADVRALAANGTRVVATSPSAGSIFGSTDGGSTWNTLLSGSGAGEINGAVTIDPAAPNTILASDFNLPARDSQVIRSDDGGAHWTSLPSRLVPPLTAGLVSPPPIASGGATGAASLYISAPQPTATTVTLLSSDTTVATVPPSVTVPANQTGPIIFNVTSLNPGSANIVAFLPANLGGLSASAGVTVVSPPIVSVSISCLTTNIPAGTTASTNVIIGASQSSPTTISLHSSNTAILTVPATVTIPASGSSAFFTITAVSAGSATITATMPSNLGGSSTDCLTTIGDNAPVSVTLTGPTTEIIGGASGSASVTIAAAQTSATTLTLTSSDPTIATVQANVTIPAGLTTTNFSVTGVAGGTATITATLPLSLGGTYANASVAVVAPSSATINGYALVLDPTRSSTVYAAGPGTPNVARSTVGGAAWTDAAVPSSGGSAGYVYTLAIDPTSPSTLYAGLSGSGITRGAYKSTDGGSTWSAINTGLPGAPSSPPGINSIVVDPIDPTLLHLGSSAGYFYSTDAGATWTAANSGLPNASAQTIYALVVTGNHHVIAATGAGLYLLSINPPPAITSIAPVAGNVAGGTSVTISGSNFQAGATVTIGGVAATNVTVVNSSTITATTPAHAAGTVDVLVANFDGRSATLASSFTYTATPAPAVSSVSPTSGSTSGGTSVTISGTNFTAGATVSFGGSAGTNVAVVNGSTITATTPAHAAGAVSVSVRNGDGQTATLASGFTYIAPPFVSGVSPSSGPAGGGTSVTISGSGFMTGATVTFGGAAATGVTVTSATTITATTPSHSAGAADVTVLNPDGQSGVLAGAFTYTATLLKGDANGDGQISVSDVFYLIDYLFENGSAPQASMDINADGVTNVGDVFYLINYLFTGGPAPH